MWGSLEKKKNCSRWLNGNNKQFQHNYSIQQHCKCGMAPVGVKGQSCFCSWIMRIRNIDLWILTAAGVHFEKAVLHYGFMRPVGITHDDVIKWKQFPRYWPFMRGIHWSPVNSPHKSQWSGAWKFSLICSWMNGWVNNRKAGDLKRHRTHYDVTVITVCHSDEGIGSQSISKPWRRGCARRLRNSL